MSAKPDQITAFFASDPPPLAAGLTHPAWARAPQHLIDRDWRGDPAPSALATSARLIWTPDELLIGFSCLYEELDIDREFDVETERYALWERDVCEAFIRSPGEPGLEFYKEFEIAPTGQWCDLLVDRRREEYDWEWRSGMRTAGRIDPSSLTWTAVMAIPFAAFGEAPSAGWWGNLFRVSRIGGERRYLAFSPTRSERPNFHVPERFVPLAFAPPV
jgi:hypothetical protein